MLIEVIGWIGAVCFVVAYALVSRGKLDGKGKSYNWANLIGAMLYILYGFERRTFPVVFLETIWAIIALYALYCAYRRNNTKKHSQHPSL